jgi:hypothetical protein
MEEAWTDIVRSRLLSCCKNVCLAEQRLQFHRYAHVAFDFYFTAHHRHHRVEFTLAQGVEGIDAGDDGAVRIFVFIAYLGLLASQVQENGAFIECKLEGFANAGYVASHCLEGSCDFFDCHCWCLSSYGCGANQG